MPIEGTRKRVSQFYGALSLALLDRKLELANVPISFYYDTDVVLRMIMGFELARPGGQPPSESENLVRALLACGYLGKVEMLRPHALELANNLPKPNHYSRPSDREVFRNKANDYVRNSGIELVLSELRSIVHSDVEEGQKIDAFLNFLRDKAGSTFVAIERVSGSWLQRLRRQYDEDLIIFDRLGPEMDELLRQDGGLVHEITRILRPERPARFTLSIFSDAAALAIVHRFVRSYEAGETNRVVRFYTETKSLQQAVLASPRLRELLSYDLPAAKTGAGVGSLAIRDSYYFVMRAWFRELNPSDKEASLDAVEDLSRKLSDLLELTGENFEKAVLSAEIDGRNLIELINGFDRLAIMDSIWVRGRIPPAVTNYFKDWTEVFSFARGEGAEQKVFQRISDVREKIELKIARIRNWTKDFDLVLRSAESKRKQIRGQIEDPMRDLGLVRWGYNLSEEEQKELVSLVGPLIQESEEEISVQAGELATMLQQARYDAVQCGVACAALWALGRFDEIVELVDECEVGKEASLPPNLYVIRAAAAMKGGSLGHEQRREIVQKVWMLTNKLSEDQKRGILLGVGYVLYHAWKQGGRGSRIHSMVDNNLPEEIHEWAKISFKAGEDASYLLPTGSLAWSFAVNHCAYVGIVTAVEPQKAAEYLDELIMLQGFPVWNNRFDDTLGISYLLEAEKLLESQMAELPWEHLGYLVKRAGEYFERAKEKDFGDIDINEHVSRLDQVRIKSELLRSGSGG